MQKMANDFSKEKQSLKSIILQYFDILRKAASIEKYISKDEQSNGRKLLQKYNKIVYGQDEVDWNQLFQVMNKFQNGFYDKVREKYPQLSDMEFRVCCLSCETGFDDIEIAIIIGKSVDMVRKLRSNIRKKIGIPAYNHDIYSFISQDILSEK